jgi:hypothetical protein
MRRYNIDLTNQRIIAKRQNSKEYSRNDLQNPTNSPHDEKFLVHSVQTFMEVPNFSSAS